MIPPTEIMGGPAVYDVYPIDRYQLDDAYGVTDLGAALWEDAANVFLLIDALVIKIAIRVIEWTFTLNLVNRLLGPLGTALQTLGDVLWQANIIQLGIVVAGIYAAWNGLVLRRSSRAAGALISTVLVVAVGTWSLGGGLLWTVRTVNAAATDLNRSVIGLNGGGAIGADLAIMAAGEAVWVTFVEHPWAIAEFGSLETASRFQMASYPGDEILNADTPTRKEWYKATVKKQPQDLTYWQADKAVSRFVVASLTGTAGSVVGIGLIATAGAVLLYQTLAILLILFTPVVLVLALLLPNAGSVLLGRWAVKLLGCLFSKVLLGGLLAAVLLLSMAMYSVAGAYAWSLAAGLQAVAVVAVAVKWREVGNLLRALPRSPETALEHLGQWEGARAISSRIRGAGAIVTGLAGGGAALSRRGYRAASDYAARQEATGTLNRRLAEDRLKAAEKGKPTPLMRTVERRVQQGARRIWTQAEIEAEMRRNKSLWMLGADPRAVAAGGGEVSYRNQVARIWAEDAQTQREIGELQGSYAQRVTWQRGERGGLAKPADPSTDRLPTILRSVPMQAFTADGTEMMPAPPIAAASDAMGLETAAPPEPQARPRPTIRRHLSDDGLDGQRRLWLRGDLPRGPQR